MLALGPSWACEKKQQLTDTQLKALFASLGLGISVELDGGFFGCCCLFVNAQEQRFLIICRFPQKPRQPSNITLLFVLVNDSEQH